MTKPPRSLMLRFRLSVAVLTLLVALGVPRSAPACPS